MPDYQLLSYRQRNNMHRLSNTGPLKILVVEDNLGDFLLLKEYIGFSAIQVDRIDTVDRLQPAIEYLNHNKPDIIFLDLYLPDSSGLASYNQLKKYITGSAVIVLSGLSDTKTALEAIANGAQDYLAKGEFDEKLLAKTIFYAIERLKSIETLRIANERYSLVAKATHDLVWDWDLATGNVYRDEQAVINVYGCSNEKIKHIDDWSKRIHPDDAIRVSSIIRDLDQLPGDSFEIEYRFRAETGEYKYIYDRGYITRDHTGRAIRIIGAANDITEKRKLEKALQEDKIRQQKAIAEATIRGQENERQQLGIELHDNITQILATARIYLESAMSGTDPQARINKSRELIAMATQELRKLSHTLLPPSLQEFGLKQALHELTDTIAQTGLFHFNKQWDYFDEQLLHKDQQLTIYRIVQEQMNNIIKHAGAKHVHISLCLVTHDDEIELMIKDDGKGFDPSQKRNGVGLRNIISRAELYDGQVSIHSSPGQGCELKVIFPVEATCYEAQNPPLALDNTVQ
jgi:two-component system, NarL family, sensor histidine kinase UhpB